MTDPQTGTAMEIAGAGPAVLLLDGLANALRNTVLRLAVFDALKSSYQSMRSLAPASEDGPEPGLLRRSIGRKVKVYRYSGIVVGLVGPRTKMGVVVGKHRDGTPRSKVPTKYAHFAERRTGFMSKSWDPAKAEQRIAEKIALEVEKRA